MNTTTTTNSNATGCPIDFAALENNSKAGRVTLDMLVAQTGMNKASVRKALVSHFGSRITFARGRVGGIRIV
jgi:ABC-type uncharacterized transport system permease subunit